MNSDAHRGNRGRALVPGGHHTGPQRTHAGADQPAQHSGKFMVRVPSKVHRKLALEAAEENVALNRVISAKLLW